MKHAWVLAAQQRAALCCTVARATAATACTSDFSLNLASTLLLVPTAQHNHQTTLVLVICPTIAAIHCRLHLSPSLHVSLLRQHAVVNKLV